MLRLAAYLTSCSNDTSCAVILYRRNVEVASAFWEAIAYVEVALRNLLDRKMTERQVELGRTAHWIFDDNYELGRSHSDTQAHRQPFKEISDAMGRVRKNRKPMTPSQIISELSFGFWHQLVSKRQLFLWPGLASGFINAPSRDQNYISGLTLEIRDLRNRIGHHHRLNEHSIDSGHLAIIKLAGAIDEDLLAWIMKDSRITAICGK